jgi:hypothetical protein
MDVALVDALASGETWRSDDDLVAVILATALTLRGGDHHWALDSAGAHPGRSVAAGVGEGQISSTARRGSSRRPRH